MRLLTGTEEGIVTRLLDNELVEVAIDNDFTIPVLRRELVPVAAEEGKAFDRPAPEGYRPGVGSSSKKPKGVQGGQPKQPRPAAAPTGAPATAAGAPASAPPPPRPAAPAAKGVYLALVQQSPELLAVQLLNNTEGEVLFTYGEERGEKYRALAADKLGAKAASRPLAHLHLQDFDQWPAVVFQLLSFKLNGDAPYELLSKRQAFKASTFYTSRRPAPVLGKEAYLFQLDEKPAPALEPQKLDAAQATALQRQLSGDAPKPQAPSPEPRAPVAAPPHELDLHVEALRPEGAEGLSNAAILRLQLDAFEDALSRALATNMHEIVFIHGAGNGTLRKEIHRQLSRNKDIKFFEDARREKFGYGATLVRLK